MHSFEVSLGYESVDRTTFSMKRGKECIQFLNNVRLLQMLLKLKRYSYPDFTPPLFLASLFFITINFEATRPVNHTVS